MKRLFAVVVLSLALGAPMLGQDPGAQTSSPPPAASMGAANGISRPDKMDAPETNNEEEQFRHSSVVAAIARRLHVSTEVAAKIFEDFNSAVLILAIFGFLVRALPKKFRKRREALRKELTEARLATEDANRRLAGVEERLSKLDTEIAAIHTKAERDSVEDEKKIRAAMEAERQRIVESAGREVDAAGAAAQRELKRFAADLAVSRAMERIQLSPADDRYLVREFAESLPRLAHHGLDGSSRKDGR